METTILLYPAQWVQLPIEVRRKLAEDFNLKRSGGNSVTTDNGRTRIDSDGYNAEDLRGINRESMLEYLGRPADDKEGFWPLLDLTVAKARRSLEPLSESMHADELPPAAPGVQIPVERVHTSPKPSKKK